MQTPLHIEVEESLAVEVGLILSLASGYLSESLLPDPILEFISKTSKERLRKLSRFLGPDKSLEHTSMMVLLAFAGDCLVTGDAAAFLDGLELAKISSLCERLGAAKRGRASQRTKADVVEALVKFSVMYDRLIGIPVVDFDSARRHVVDQIERLIEYGESNSQRREFLRELRHFLEDDYLPWRLTRKADVTALASEAKKSLRFTKNDLKGRLEWLAKRYPAAADPGFMPAVQTLNLRVVVIPAPFGPIDYCFGVPGILAVSAHAKSDAIEFFSRKMNAVSLRIKAIADPTRLLILRLIRQNPAHASHVARTLGLARPTVSIHASILEEAKLIRTRIEGRKTVMEISPEGIWNLLDDLERALDVQRK